MDKKVARLLKKPQPQQLTQEWFSARQNAITASSAASLLIRDNNTCDNYIKLYNLQDTFKKDYKCCNPYSSKFDYFKTKVFGSKFKGSEATFHGQKYEKVASDIYSVKFDASIFEFGLITHETIPWLAASPDGITEKGIMIEIKCPYRRKITGIPPFYYYIQCQLQLEVCDLEFCDFTEYTLVEFDTLQEWLDDETLEIDIHNKGLLIQIQHLDEDGLPEKDTPKEYEYPPKQYIDNTAALIGWSNHCLANINKDLAISVSVVYYKVTDASIVRIKRDQEWFNAVKPVLEKEWNKIIYYRQGANKSKLIEEEVRSFESVPVVMSINYSKEDLRNNCPLSDTESDM